MKILVHMHSDSIIKHPKKVSVAKNALRHHMKSLYPRDIDSIYDLTPLLVMEISIDRALFKPIHYISAI